MNAAGAEAPLAVSLRERKKSATRAALRRSAMRLVASRGPAAVTVEDIAADANVSARTFFNYFDSKEDAIIGWDPSVLRDMVDLLRDRPADEAAPVALRAVLLEVLPSLDDDHRELLERLQVVRSSPHLMAHHASRWAETERQLVAALAERQGADTAHHQYTALVVATTLAAGRVAMLSWCSKEGQVPLAEELAFHLDVLGAGLAEPERSVP
jgi:AcrR family transcriptional regulator